MGPENEAEAEGGVDAAWPRYEGGKRLDRTWLKSRGAQRCMRCGERADIAQRVSRKCQQRGTGARDARMRAVTRPRALNRICKGARQRKFPSATECPACRADAAL
ncbi:unnamed protein product [Prorocentrum cordatum]|uniref:Uncharacterized protein n=1 Tax=Prorocentrum cordatum TaxID=2364126 RepID=A0ABN9PSF9_9DINO|nr:unnamed protein product [Polarella glacialis]